MPFYKLQLSYTSIINFLSLHPRRLILTEQNKLHNQEQLYSITNETLDQLI